MSDIETENSSSRRKIALILLSVLGAILLIAWLLNTPPGIFGKADAIGYSFCHRIDSRSFHIGDIQFPLCARCSGMYLGALLALIFQMILGKKNGGFPNKGIIAVLAIFFLAFAVDGSNSLLQIVLKDGLLYKTTNTTRLITGTGVGLGIGMALYPLFHQSVWVFYDRKPVIDSWKKFGLLLGFAVLLILAVLSDIHWLLYPLALLSAATVFVILVVLYTILMILITKQDNKFTNYSQFILPLLIGFVIALGQVALLNYLRYMLTGTWGGFPPLP